jgi:hypothetical protein
MGLFLEKILKAIPLIKKQKQIFWLFAGSCLPAYFLSALWLNMPTWAYAIIVLAAILQLIAWILLIRQIAPNYSLLSTNINGPVKWLLLFSGIALSVKLLLQTLSTIPSISTLAFGFRPIVIAYLHLILLGMISLFLLANFLSAYLVQINKMLITGIIIFVFGIIFNECLLMTQGVAAILEQSVNYMNELLLLAAGILFSGMLLLNLGINKRT